MVARQTLTLFVGVRIPIPLPNKNPNFDTKRIEVRVLAFCPKKA